MWVYNLGLRPIINFEYRTCPVTRGLGCPMGRHPGPTEILGPDLGFKWAQKPWTASGFQVGLQKQLSGRMFVSSLVLEEGRHFQEVFASFEKLPHAAYMMIFT